MSDGTWSDSDLLVLLGDVCDAVGRALDASDRSGWKPLGASGAHRGQYGHDVVADAAALGVLRDAGVGVLSEESGLTSGLGPVVVIDPVDGSTNAARGIPWFATSVCAVDDAGPRAAIVRNQATGEQFWAIRGTGAYVGPTGPNARRLTCEGAASWSRAVVLVSGAPHGWMGWKQYRSLGACALDLCMVAAGRADAYVDLSPGSAHGVWDYLGGLLVLQEAGGSITDGAGAELVVLDPAARRSPVAAVPGLIDDAVAARRKIA